MIQAPLLILACGCAIHFRDGETPFCAIHGEQRVAETQHMPAPRIRGCATGPHVQTEELRPYVERLVDSPPLLKDRPTHG